MVTVPENTGVREPRQDATYRNYIELARLGESRFDGSLAGKLIAAAGFRRNQAELSIATNIAGGCFLGIEPDQQVLKAAVRNGSCDFMVNTLDEALRVLKNEIRKRQPLAVGLAGELKEVLAEMAERGVQPDIVADATQTSSNAEPDSILWLPFLQQGAISMAAQVETGSMAGDFTPIVWIAVFPDDMRRLDHAALQWLPSDDSTRKHWLEHASTRFYREQPLERVLGATAEEIPSLMESLKASRPWRGTVSVRWLAQSGPQSVVL